MCAHTQSCSLPGPNRSRNRNTNSRSRAPPRARVDSVFGRLAQQVAPLLRGPATPPALRQVSGFTRTVRYQCQSGGLNNANFGIDDLLDMFFIATSATTGVRLCRTARLERIDIWGPATTPSATSNVGVVWSSTATSATDDLGAPEVPLIDVCMGVFDAPVIHTRPPTGSVASMWQSGTTATEALCALTCPDFSIIDFTATFIVAAGTSAVFGLPPASVVRGVVGAVAGTLYTSTLFSTAVPLAAATI